MENNTEFITDINPLDEAVNEKRYTQANVDTSGIDFSKPIDEPSFQPPPFKKNPNAGSSTSTFVDDKKEQPKREPINPEMKNLSKKDTKSAAKAAANLTIQAYEWLHGLGNKFLQVSEKQLNKLQASGEINLDAVIQYDYGSTIRAGEFIKEYNTQVSTMLEVSNEFKEEATPLLEEVFEKRGIGLTTEQQLMFVFGKDIAAKALIVFQQKQQLKHMIEVIKESTTSLNAQRQAQAAPPPPPPATDSESVEKVSPIVIVEPEEYEIDSNKAIEDKPKKKGRPRKYNI